MVSPVAGVNLSNLESWCIDTDIELSSGAGSDTNRGNEDNVAVGGGFTDSKLVTDILLSPNRTAPRNKPISKVTIHHVGGILNALNIGRCFQNPDRQASANYGIGNDCSVGLYVNECNRAWTSSSPPNDHMAVTIEVSNSKLSPEWLVSDAVFRKTIELVTDICLRNGIERLIFDGTANGNLTYHSMFNATICPGPYLKPRFNEIASEVNRVLDKAKIDSDPKNTPSSWAEAAWIKATAYGIIDGTRPHDAVTREEFAAVIVRLCDRLNITSFKK